MSLFIIVALLIAAFLYYWNSLSVTFNIVQLRLAITSAIITETISSIHNNIKKLKGRKNNEPTDMG